MSVKAFAAIVAVGEGASLNVSEICRSEGVSRKTFYKYVNRYKTGGMSGLEERSRRPLTSPRATSAVLEDEVVRLRKELDDASLDCGATTIQWHLRKDRRWRGKVPAVATVHRILVRRGLIVAQPNKRPKCSFRRFEAPAPNEWWQIDSMDWEIVTGPVVIFNLLDDHSRLLARSHAAPAATTRAAWQAFCLAVEVWGLPAAVLSDNGLSFSGKLRGFEVFFEANLRDAGVRPFTGRPYHPQTTGKVERFQQTLKKWLRGQPLANDLAELQAQLDTFQQIYNYERPHQGIGRVTPASRWHASPASGPAAEPLAHPEWPSRTLQSLVDPHGRIATHRYMFHVGVEWAGQRATIVLDHSRANVFINDELVRHYKLNPARRYQPSGRPRSRKHHPA